MDNTLLQQRKVWLGMLLGLASFLIYNFSLRAMLARQEGLNISEALARAAGGLVPWLPVAIVFAVFFLLGSGLFRKPVESGDAVEAGLERWRRLRLWLTISIVPALLILPGLALYLFFNGQWSNGWFIVVVWAIYAAILAGYWLKSPSRERLYAMGSGDTSRIMDERAQQVQEKAARSTIGALFLLLLFAWIPYKMIVEGNLPWDTLALLALLGIMWVIASSYWNRRL